MYHHQPLLLLINLSIKRKHWFELNSKEKNIVDLKIYIYTNNRSKTKSPVILLSDVYPLTLTTKNIALCLHKNKEIVLNCTYHKESNEFISNRNIRWQKWIGNTFKDLATFSPPGGQSPFIGIEMESLYSNRTELIAPTDGSLSAILILKDLVCDDVGEYRCWVDYYFDEANHVSTSTSKVVFEGKK